MLPRRRILTGLLSLTAGLFAARQVTAQAEAPSESLRFPGDPTEHNVIVQYNKADADYQNAVLFGVGELLRKYQDNITIVVTAFGPGIHILAKKPLRPVAFHVQQKVKSLAQYGVKFHACGNTMDSLDWTRDDLLEFVEVVQVGAADIMEHQEKGFSYLSW